MASDAAIRVSGLHKSYGEHEAVRGIDFEVARGRGLRLPRPQRRGQDDDDRDPRGLPERTAGEVSVLGADPGKPTREWRERIGLVLQECELDPLLTVRETMTEFASFYPSPRDVDETIELVGLAGKRDARVGSLSGGQRRRLDVGVAIVGDPELLFLDEPTTGFDPTARRDAWNMIEGLRASARRSSSRPTTWTRRSTWPTASRSSAEGQIVAEGSPATLGAELGRRDVIRFRVPDGIEPSRSPRLVGGGRRSPATRRPSHRRTRSGTSTRCCAGRRRGHPSSATSRSGGRAWRTSSSSSPAASRRDRAMSDAGARPQADPLRADLHVAQPARARLQPRSSP